ncbi:MAG: hypothetical protein R3282_07165, partial [Rhodothermales bacterium]|nr:hypothetical protein [Rhodothermales bacterium]
MIARAPHPWFAVLLALSLTIPIADPAPAQSVRAYSEADSVAIGERFDVVVAVDRSTSSSIGVTFPALPPDTMGGTLRFGDLLILDVVAHGSQQGSRDIGTDSVIYEATTFALDTAIVGSIPVLLTVGADTLILTTDPFFMLVRSVVPADAEDIMDLLPIAEFRPPIWPWLIFVGVLLVAMAAFIYWYRRSRPEIVLERESKAALPPHEEALERLDELDEMRLDTDVAIEQFCVDLADTLRTYLWRRASVHSLEMTTGELVPRLAAMEESEDM